MKTAIMLLAAVMLTLTVHAQDKDQKKTKAEQPTSTPAERVAKEAEAKKVELAPNTRAKLNDIRYQIYNFGTKPGC